MLTRADKARLKQLIEDDLPLTREDLAALRAGSVDGAAGPGTCADAAFSESQERLELVLKASSDGFWDYDVTTGRFFFSARMAEMLGYAPEEIPADVHFWDALIHPDDREQAAQAMREHFAQRTPGYQVEFRLRTKQGEWIWVVDHGQTVKWSAAGKPLRIVGTHTEITERKLAQESLRLSEQRYRDLIERSQQPIVVLQDFRAVFANYALGHLLGYSDFEDLRSVKLLDAVDPADHERVSEYYRALLRGETLSPGTELRLRAKDGKCISVEVAAELHEYEGRPAVQLSLFDVTKRKQAEEQLRVALFSIDNSSDAVYWVDRDARFQYTNKAASEGLGYTQDELLNMQVWDIEPGLTEDKWLRRWDERQKCKLICFEAFHRRKDGSVFPVDITSNYLEYEGKEFSCAFVRDVSARKQAEVALRESENRFRSIFESEPECVKVVAPDGTILDMNPAGMRMLEVENLEHVIGTSLLDWILPEWHQGIRHYLQEILLGKSIQIEYEIVGIKGTHRWMETHAVPLRNDQSQVNSVLAVTRDITERKSQEEDARIDQLRLGSLIKLTQLSTNSWRELLDFALDEAIALSSSKLGYIFYYNETKHELTLHAWSKAAMEACTIPGPPLVYDLEDTGIWGEAIRQSKPIIVNKFQAPHELKKGYPTGHAELIRYMTLPVFSDGHIVAVVGVANKESDYTELDARQLSLMMDSIWNIAERRQSEQALKHSEEFLRAVLDSSPLGISVRSASGRLIAYNTAWQQIWAMPEEDIEDDFTRDRQNLILDNRDDYAKPWWDEIQRVYREGGTLFVPEARTTGRRDAAAEWVSQHFYAILDAAGKVDRVVVITQDITIRKRAEDALRAKTEELDRFFSLALDLLCIADIDGNFLRLSQAWEKTLGYKIEDLEGHRFLDFVHPDDLDDTLAALSNLAQGQVVLDFVNRYRCKDGSYRWIEWRSMPFERKLVYAAARDITERRQAEAERQKLEARLSQAQKMEAIGTLAGGIAHDFNNVLFAILGNAEIIQEELAPGTAPYENMSHLIAAGNRAKGLVKQILTFSRKSQREVVSIDIEEVIKEVVRLMRATLPSTIEVKQRLNAAGMHVLADPTEIHQVVMNLCMNAAQAMEERPGAIDVSLSALDVDLEFAARHLGLKPGPHVQLRISDTGHGMSLEVKERIFEPFFTTKDSGKGTGMGLAVVHGIVAKLGGAITVYSELERGSTFNVFLPTAQATETPSSVGPRSLPTGAERVLLVDDEPEILNVTRQILRNLGYEVRTCQSSEEALAIFTQDPLYYDVVVTDQTMPKLTGAELAKQMLALRPELPVILCTGYSPAVSHESAAGLGIREYLYKPVLRRDLAEALRRALQQ